MWGSLVRPRCLSTLPQVGRLASGPGSLRSPHSSHPAPTPHLLSPSFTSLLPRSPVLHVRFAPTDSAGPQSRPLRVAPAPARVGDAKTEVLQYLDRPLHIWYSSGVPLHQRRPTGVLSTRGSRGRGRGIVLRPVGDVRSTPAGSVERVDAPVATCPTIPPPLVAPLPPTSGGGETRDGNDTRSPLSGRGPPPRFRRHRSYGGWSGLGLVTDSWCTTETGPTPVGAREDRDNVVWTCGPGRSAKTGEGTPDKGGMDQTRLRRTGKGEGGTAPTGPRGYLRGTGVPGDASGCRSPWV